MRNPLTFITVTATVGTRQLSRDFTLSQIKAQPQPAQFLEDVSDELTSILEELSRSDTKLHG